jgi:hypothetical protein
MNILNDELKSDLIHRGFSRRNFGRIAAMITAGGCLAWLVYHYLGLKFVSRSWFNLETLWAVSLVLVGAVALAINLVEWH